MGERMKKIFILGTLLCATTAHAEIPTMQYLYEFYERECGWPAEMGLPGKIEEFLQRATGQTIPKSAIATQWMPLAFVDSFNGNTTYAQDLTTNNVVSVGYLQSSLNLINSPMCCKNGLQFDPGSFSCIGTITCPDGTALDPAINQCVACPANLEGCCPDLWNVNSGTCVICPANFRGCCPDTWDDRNGVCVSCQGADEVWDSVFGMCLAPDDIYDDAYTGTMTSGYTCSPHSYVRENVACPTGWERVELSHATVATSERDTASSDMCPAGTMNYTGGSLSSELETCALTISGASAAPASASVDVCLPPVDGKITTVTYRANSNTSESYFTIGQGCSVTDNNITCDITYVKGHAHCDEYWKHCSCSRREIMTPNGTVGESWSGSFLLKRFNTLDNCTANCAYDCARAIQTMPGFRHVVLIDPYGSCGM